MESVDQWLTLKVCELSRLRATTARAVGAGFGFGFGSAAVRKPPALLRGDLEQTRRRVGALRVNLRASYTWNLWIRHISVFTVYAFNSRSRPPVCYRASRHPRRSGRSGAGLLAVLLIIPCKASSYITLRLALDFTGIITAGGHNVLTATPPHFLHFSKSFGIRSPQYLQKPINVWSSNASSLSRLPVVESRVKESSKGWSTNAAIPVIHGGNTSSQPHTSTPSAIIILSFTLSCTLSCTFLLLTASNHPLALSLDRLASQGTIF